MHLRVETAQPYTLFPTKPTFVNHPPPSSYPYPPQSTLGYHPQYHPQQQPFSNILPYPHQYHSQQYQQQPFSYNNGGNYNNNATTVKRSSSAFEPLFYQQPQQQQVLPPSPPTTPISSMDGAPTLADFAASIVYLMWHARKPFLLAAMKSASPNRHSFSSLPGNASPAFKRFCLQVLTATQLSESAVFLALKYIANLLESNPSIEGAEGSEYRLFIVALMLANKFLDDNTFTNKTWSEVSGMKVQDLNIMESEFLEALEYHLFVREEEYTAWQSILDTCRQRYIQQHQQTSMTSSLANTHPLQRHEWITSTLHSLGLDKSSSSVGHKHLDDQQQQDYIETDDDDEDDDDDEEEQADQDADDDDDEEMFQMMHQQHHLRQQEVEQQQQQQQQQGKHQHQHSQWPTAAATSTTARVQMEQSQQPYQLYRMQPEQRQYHHPSSMTTPPLSLSSHHRTERPSAFSKHTPDTTATARNDTGRSSSFMPYVPSSNHHHALQPHRSSSVYRSSTTSVPPGFQRRASPWEPLRDRCGDSFYSHQPFHPYQRQATIAPPSFRTATTGYGA